MDRQAALGWLGIEGYRPSGRVRPVARLARVDAEGRDDPRDGIAPEGDSSVVAQSFAPAVERIETPPEPAASGEQQPQAAAVVPTAASTSAYVEAAPADDTPTERVTVAPDSPHRALAETIARLAGLACETDDAGDVLRMGGEIWDLAALAGDGQAKRRLWHALVARGRRARA